MSAKTYKATPQALESARRLHIEEDRLLQMAKRAARITHPDATHCFRQYLLTVQPDGLVTFIDVMSTEENQYYSNRTYDERRRDQEEIPTPLGEAIVTRKRR